MTQKQAACDCSKATREPADEALVLAVPKHAQEVHHMEMTREKVLSMASRSRSGRV